MNTDGAFDFPAAPKQIPECQVGLDRVAVDFEHFHEGIDRLVRLLVQQVVQPAKIHGPGLADTLALVDTCTAPRGEPAGGRRDG